MSTQGFSRILLATDGSEEANTAVKVTRAFAHASAATVKVVHMWNLEVHHRHGLWDVEMRSEAERLINETVDRLRTAHIEASGEVFRAATNQVAAAVAEAAREFGADLVVIGSRGLSDWQSMRKHSVSHQLLSAVDCPVLIVRGKSGIRGRDVQRVLLAIAGGDDLVPGVQAAIAAASTPGSQVLVVHVAQAIVGVTGYAYIERDEEINETMKTATALLEQAGVATTSKVAEAGPVARVVAEIAARWRADVIVIGSSRTGDLGSLLLGSVTHDLLRVTERPVLVAERIRR
ncbi:MAG: universal stress protein [Candidatus Dormiibacterota bacterium]